MMKPDLNTMRRIPWLDGTALVLCDVLDHHHEPVPHSPRAILKKQLGRLEKMVEGFYLYSNNFCGDVPTEVQALSSGVTEYWRVTPGNLFGEVSLWGWVHTREG